MIRVCPMPGVWHDRHQRLLKFAETTPCKPDKPPIPLILAGWAYSSDFDKKSRWEKTLAWAERNGCADLVANISDVDFYSVRSEISDVDFYSVQSDD